LRSRYLSYEQGKQLHNLLDSHEMVDGTDIVPSCMLLKSDAELNYIRKAALYTQSGMQAAIDALAVGATDNSVAAEAYHAIVAAGSEYMSSDPIVCAGANSAVPHGHFSNRHVAAGDIVLLELSGCAGRYSAPLMRAVSMGPADSRVRTAAETCREALEEILSAMAPGRPFSDAARRGRAVIEKAGPNMIFHGTYAYSIGAGFPGVSWADAPVEVRDDSRGQFESGMVLHMPISLRLRGEFGVAISETVAITAQGLEVVTQFERQLFVR
jgi:Xaa-Pro aminopeptidase